MGRKIGLANPDTWARYGVREPIRAHVYDTTVAHRVAELARREDSPSLQAGEIVTTGTIATAQSIRPGEAWQSAIEGIALRGLEIAFEA